MDLRTAVLQCQQSSTAPWIQLPKYTIGPFEDLKGLWEFAAQTYGKALVCGSYHIEIEPQAFPEGSEPRTYERCRYYLHPFPYRLREPLSPTELKRIEDERGRISVVIDVSFDALESDKYSFDDLIYLYADKILSHSDGAREIADMIRTPVGIEGDNILLLIDADVTGVWEWAKPIAGAV